MQDAEQSPEQLLERVSDYAKSQLLNLQESLSENKFRTSQESAIAELTQKSNSLSMELKGYVLAC